MPQAFAPKIRGLTKQQHEFCNQFFIQENARQAAIAAGYEERGYGVGHTFTLNEGERDLDGFRYTGRRVSGMISHLDDFGCDFGYLNLSLSKVGLLIVEEPEMRNDNFLPTP